MRDLWRRQVSFVLDHPSHLNDWESDFIDSMTVLVEHDDSLSIKQSFKLSKIYKRVEWEVG
jgi:hypothetical protein